MKELSAMVKNGELNGEDYLTARFDIPQVLVVSQPMQDNQKLDIYSEQINFDQDPVIFLKDSKETHKLRATESYILDSKGDRIYKNNNCGNLMGTEIRSSQYWKLNENLPGISEISANLYDILLSPEGDLDIDPSMIFQGNSITFDSVITSGNPNYCYGYSTIMDVGMISVYDIRTVISIRIDDIIQTKYPIQSAILNLTISSFPNSSETIQTRAYEIISDWSESNVTWNSRFSGVNWTTPGGDYNSSVASDIVNISNSYSNPIRYDVTKIIQSHASQDIKDVSRQGILIKTLNLPNISCSFKSSEATSDRPSLTITYNTPQLGGHASSIWDFTPQAAGSVDDRINNLNADNLKIHRYYFEDNANKDIVKQLSDKESPAGSKFIYDFHVFGIVFTVTKDVDGNIIDYTCLKTPAQYASWVTSYLQNIATYVNDGTIAGIEIANEEDNSCTYKDNNGTVTGHPVWKLPDLQNPVSVSTLTSAGWHKAGENLGVYIAAARDAIKNLYPNLPIIAPAINFAKGLNDLDAYSQPTGSNAFLRGIISKIINDNGGSLSKLPDGISVHGYANQNRPEGIGDSGTYQYWYNRLNTLDSICSSFNYYPQFLQTEYGFSDNTSSGWTCINGSETSQAIYYMRRLIMDTVMRSHNSSDKSKFWNCSLIYTHLWDYTGVENFSKSRLYQ